VSESPKVNDSVKDVKALLDAGTPDSEISDAMMARLLRSWLISAKQDGVELKNGNRALKVNC
jgi:hypothetical protein